MVPFMIRTFPDGTMIEIRATSSGNPPGSDPAKQASSGSTVWVRVGGQDWFPLSSRSCMRPWLTIKSAATFAEAIQSLFDYGYQPKE